jgi:putative DNA primase/helicase
MPTDVLRGRDPMEVEENTAVLVDAGFEPVEARDAALLFKLTERSARDAFHNTDAGNADRLVHRHGDRIRYVYKQRRWLAWDGRCWSPDALGAVEQYAQDTVRSMYADAARITDSAEREKAVKWAMSSEGIGRLDAMVKASRSKPGVAITPDVLDSNPWALNVQNGILDLKTGELRPHDPSEMHSKLAGAAYASGVPAPRWERFLEEVLPDAEVRRYFQKLAGYSLAGDVGENVLPFAYGAGANGKSVAFHVLRTVLGDYATEAAPDLLVARRERGIPVDIMDLEGFRFVTAVEVEAGRRMATDVMKKITGDPVLKARRMRQDFEQFDNVTTLWMAGNDRPEVDGLDEAVWRRVRLIPFTVTIPAGRRDPALAGKLVDERDGILRWLVDGLMAYHREGLTAPAAVLAATDEYRQDSNPLNDWFEAECESDEAAKTPNAKLRDAYERWCVAHRVAKIPRGAKWREGLGRLGCSESEASTGKVWSGVRLRQRQENGGLAV